MSIGGGRQIRGTWAAAIVAVSATFLALAFAADAGAYLYWSNAASKAVGRSKLDGSEINPSFLSGLGEVRAVAVGSSHVYWVNFTDGTIGRASLDGSGAIPNLIQVPGNPIGIAADSAHIYWTNSNGLIGRANLDGSGVELSFIVTNNQPGGIAVDGSHIYWARFGGNIGRANLDGSDIKQDFVVPASPGSAGGIAIDGSHLYWTNRGTSPSISRANLDGSGVNESFIPTPNHPLGLAVDGTHVYWANESETIGRANLDGSGVSQGFAVVGGEPDWLATDPFPLATSISFGCVPAKLNLPAPAICTATVSAAFAAPKPLSGPVSFTAGAGGAFSAPSSCSLVPSGPAQATCHLTYTPTAVGNPVLSAAFGGDLFYGQTATSATLRANPSNAFSIVKRKLNRRKGTATLVAKVPGPGRLVIAGKGIQRGNKPAAGAGRVKLVVKPLPRIVKKLRRSGKARLREKVAYTPSGGDPSSRTLKLTLKLNG
jgi:virginiamycin B lyase